MLDALSGICGKASDYTGTALWLPQYVTCQVSLSLEVFSDSSVEVYQGYQSLPPHHLMPLVAGDKQHVLLRTVVLLSRPPSVYASLLF